MKQDVSIYRESYNEFFEIGINLWNVRLAIVNTIVPLAFPGIRLDQSEVMNELREITLLFLNFSTISFWSDRSVF